MGSADSGLGASDALISAYIVAKRLGVKRAEVYDWLRTSSPVPAYRVGKNALRFRWSEVQAWLEERRVRG